MPHAYTEDQLVEQPAIGLFAELFQSPLARRQTPIASGLPEGRLALRRSA